MKIATDSKVEYIDHMGSDLSVVNSARVSFDKQSEWAKPGSGVGIVPDNVLSDKDKKLVKYLSKHQHWSPFAHTSIQLRVTAPIFVSRQLVKHQVGGVWNEVSRRYVDEEPEFYLPSTWRKRADNVKQGSSDDTVYLDGNLMTPFESTSNALTCYNSLLRQGVAPEQARIVLPQNMMTSWYWTGSLMFFNRVFKQRIDSHAQRETQDVAIKIGVICSDLFPWSWMALNEP